MNQTSLSQYIDQQLKARKPATTYDTVIQNAVALVLRRECTLGPGDGDCLIDLFIAQILSKHAPRNDTITQFHNFIMQSYKAINFVSIQSYGMLFQKISEALSQHMSIAPRLVYLLTNIIQYRSAAVLSLPRPAEEAQYVLRKVMECCFLDMKELTVHSALAKNIFVFFTAVPTRLPSICSLLWTAYLSPNSFPCRILTTSLLSATYSIQKMETTESPTGSRLNRQQGAARFYKPIATPTEIMIMAFKTLSSYLRNAEQCLAAAECFRVDRLSYTSYSQMLGSSLLGFYEMLETCFKDLMEWNAPSQELITAYTSVFRLFWMAISPSRLNLPTQTIVCYATSRISGQKKRLALSAASSVLTGLKRELLRRSYIPSKDSDILIPVIQAQMPLFISVCTDILSILYSTSDFMQEDCEQMLSSYVEYLAEFFGIFPIIGHFAELFPFIPSFKICFIDSEMNIPLTVLRRLTFHDADGARLQCLSWRDCQASSEFCSALTVHLLQILNMTSFTASGEPAYNQEFTEDRNVSDFFMGCPKRQRRRPASSVAVVPSSSQDQLSTASQPYLFIYALMQNELRQAKHSVDISKEIPYSFLNSALDEVLGTFILDQVLTCSTFLLENMKDLDSLLRGIELFYLLSKLPLYYLEELSVVDMMTIFKLSLQAVNICITSWPFSIKAKPTMADDEEKSHYLRLNDLFANAVSSYCHLLESDVISSELSRDEEEIAVDKQAVDIILKLLTHEDYPTKVHCKVVIGIMALLRRHKTAQDAERVLGDSGLLHLALKLCQAQTRLQGYMIRVIRFLFMRVDENIIITNSVLGLPLSATLDCILDGLTSRDRICFNSITSLDTLFVRLGELDSQGLSVVAVSRKAEMISYILQHLAKPEFRERITPLNGGIIIKLLTFLSSLFTVECSSVRSTTLEALSLVLDLATFLSEIIPQLQQYQNEAKRLLRKLIVSICVTFLGSGELDPQDPIAVTLTAHGTILLQYLTADRDTLSYHLHDTQKQADRLRQSVSLTHSQAPPDLLQPGLCSTSAVASDLDREASQKALVRVRARYDKCNKILERLCSLLGLVEGPILSR